MKRVLLLLMLCFAVCVMLCGCNDRQNVPPDGGENQVVQEPDVPPEEPDEPPEAPWGEDYTYLQDGEIPEGDPAEIVTAQGVLRETEYEGLLSEGGWLLGADDQQRIFVLNMETYNLELVSREGEQETVLENVMGDRDRQVECVYWDGGRYVAWSESVESFTWFGETSGGEWGVYLADLQTGEITCIEEDAGIRPESNYITSYAGQAELAIADGLVSYVSFTEQNGRPTPTIMLYDIAAQQLTPIGYLQGNPTENGIGTPAIGSGYVAWSQAYVLPEWLYEGYTVLYNVATGETTTWETEENVIHPHIVGDYMICESKPNETLHDGEIILFEQASGTVLRRVTVGHPSYASYGGDGVNLGRVSSCGSYFTWNGSVVSDVCLMDTQNGKLYVISKEGLSEVLNVNLYPGKLMTWGVRDVVDGELISTTYYCFLK